MTSTPGIARAWTRNDRFALATLFFAVLATSQSATGQPEFLKGDQLRATLSGHTLHGENWAEFYGPDGTIRGKARMFGVRNYVGRWSIEGNRVCYDYEGAAYDTCSRLRMAGTTVLHFDMQGSPKTDGIASRRAGNTLSAFR